MKRASIHRLFAAAILIVSCIAIWQFWHYRQLQSVNNLLAQIPASLTTAGEFLIPEKHANDPRVQLAVANAYSAGGNLQLAENKFNALIGEHENTHTGISARFNLANAYFRAGTDESTPANQRRPMLELAKQRYRDLLLIHPEHWPTRYNLERTLRLAPELINNQPEDRIDPVKRVQVIVPGFEKKDLP